MSTTTVNQPNAVKPATTKELAILYGVSPKTLRTWLQPHRLKIGERKSRYYTARQVRIIWDVLGEP